MESVVRGLSRVTTDVTALVKKKLNKNKTRK